MEKLDFDRIVNPPVLIGSDTIILIPPIGNVDAYMAYLHRHKADYDRFFGKNVSRETI